jgi:hypothetical protein
MVQFSILRLPIGRQNEHTGISSSTAMGTRALNQQKEGGQINHPFVIGRKLTAARVCILSKNCNQTASPASGSPGEAEGLGTPTLGRHGRSEKVH